MEIQTETKLAIRVKIRIYNRIPINDYWVSWIDDDFIGLNHSRIDYFAITDKFDAAADLNQTIAPEKGMVYFHSIEERLDVDESIQLVEVRRVTEFKTVDFDPEAKLEYLRRKALSKLTKSEIEALGVESLAIYNKLKFHNP